jgi:hypothetical protein
MRTLTFDPFEFDNPSTEETLELWIAAKGDFPFPDVRSFVESAASVKSAEVLGPAGPFRERFGYGMVRGYLARFAGIMVPQPCDWPTFVLNHDDTDWDGVFEAPGLFIRYHWFTTA